MQIDAGHLSIEFGDAPILTDTPEEIAALVDDIMRNAGHLALIAVADAIAIVAPSDTGELANSFRNDPASTIGGIELTGHTFVGDEVVGRLFSTLPQAVVMEGGRQPGFGVSAEGIAHLEEWAARHFGVEGKEATRAAFAIATVIRQRGLPAKDYVEAALPLAQGTIDQIFSNAGDAITSKLAGGA